MATAPTAPPSASRFSTARAVVVLLGMLACFLGLLCRVAYLQTYGRQQTLAKAVRQQYSTIAQRARRGTIYDRNGIEMAGTVQTQTLFVDPKFMQDCFQQDGKSLVDLDLAIAKLAKLLDKDAFTLSQMLGDRAQSRFVKIAEDLDETTAREIAKLNLEGCGVIPVNVRYYPMGSIASHILGGTGKDGAGLEGLEKRFEPLLAGHDGFKRTLKDARHRPVSVAAEDFLPAQHGQHLILTIDANIQMIAEEELLRTCREFRADHGEVVVMDPKTGEVLALANYPTFNPQNLGDSTNDARRNRALTDPYEPGSTIKPFIVGPAVAWKVSKFTEVFPVHGPRYQVPTYRRTVIDVHGYDELTLWDVLVKSSNIGMAMLGERMGNPKLHRAVTSWGFGRPTGIELPAEDPGRVNRLKDWNKYSTESVSQGYELMVTPLQLARAFCGYANGGRLVQPTIVKGLLDADGRVVSRVQPPRIDMMPEAVDPMTAAEVKRVLCDVPVRGTAASSGARSRTWNIFGKTGTAHISIKGGKGYSSEKFTSSFLAGAPAEDPRLVVAFIIHEPDKKIAHYGGAVAAPGAGRLIDRALTYLQVPPSPDLEPPPPYIASKLYNFDPKAYRWPTDKDAARTAAATD
jgi:cell division protein FtsI/penicillin-binding protein 2